MPEFIFLCVFRALYFFKLFLHRRIFAFFPGDDFPSIVFYFCRVLSIVTFCLYSEPEIMRHCRQQLPPAFAAADHCRSGIAASSIAASIYCSMIMRHCRSGIAASSLPPACGIAAEQIMRHCRSGIAASIYSGIAASIYSGIAASMHSHSGSAASMHIYTAALPPASTHAHRS